ncbi:MAG: hypothetical protein WCP20_10885 [Desulfuromonadales bacterium]
MTFEEWWKEQPGEHRANTSFSYNALKSLCKNAFEAGEEVGKKESATEILDLIESISWAALHVAEFQEIILSQIRDKYGVD